MTLEEEVRELAKFAKAASAKLAQATTEERNGALYAMATALRAQAPAIVEANGEDMEAARAAGTTEALLDRLMLDESRVFAMADALEEVAALPDPLGVVSLESTLYNGIELRRVSVPLGVVAMVYEARPNVTADAAGVCVKSGNACILRGGSLAARSNEVIADVLAAAAVEAGLPEGSICAVTTTDRAATDVRMGLHGLVDVLIPRGGAGLIRHCVEHAKVPVIETGIGELPRRRACLCRPRDGPRHHQEREVPPFRGVQRCRDAFGGRGGGRYGASAHSRGHEGGRCTRPWRCARARHRRGGRAFSGRRRARCRARRRGRLGDRVSGARAGGEVRGRVARGHRPREPLRHEAPPRPSSPPTRRPRTPSSPRWTRRRCTPTPPRPSPTAASSASAPRSASLPRRSTPAGPLPPTRSPLTSTCCAARAR